VLEGYFHNQPDRSAFARIGKIRSSLIRKAGAHRASEEQAEIPSAVLSSLHDWMKLRLGLPSSRSISAHQGSTGGLAPRSKGRTIAAGTAITFDAEISDIFTVLENGEEHALALAEVARAVIGKDKVLTAPEPMMGSEDFADMLRAVPGTYCWLGHSGDVPLHNPGFIFDDAILTTGARLLARLVETRLPAM
jgi:hypothetical protein